MSSTPWNCHRHWRLQNNVSRAQFEIERFLLTLCSYTELRALVADKSLICTGSTEILDGGILVRIVCQCKRCDLADTILETGEAKAAANGDAAVCFTGCIIEGERSVGIVA